MNLRTVLANNSTRAEVRQDVLLVPPTFNLIAGQFRSMCRWISGKYVAQRQARRLKVSETVSLGEKKFVSILQVDGTQFLVGGTANSITLLATIDGNSNFADVLSAKSVHAELEQA